MLNQILPPNPFSSERQWLNKEKKSYDTVNKYISILDKIGFTQQQCLQQANNSYVQTLQDGTFKNFNYLRSIFRKDFTAKNLDSLYLVPQPGGTLASALSTMLDELAYCLQYSQLSKEEAASIEQAQKNLMKAKDIALDLQAIEGAKGQNVQALRRQFIQELQSDISALKKGEKFFIPGGVPGHLMLYEVICTSEQPSRFTFKVFNSGDGIDYHFRSRTLSGSKPRTYAIHDIVLDQLIDHINPENSVISHLIEVLQGTKPVKASFFMQLKELFGMDNRYINSIYKVINTKFLDSAYSARLDRTGMPHKAQNHGSCSRKAYNFALKEEFLSPLAYEKFKVAATTLSLNRLRNLNQLEQTIYLDKKYVHTTQKTHRFTRWLLHTSFLARLYFYLFKNEISNEALIDLGQTVLEKRQHKVQQLATQAQIV